MKQQRRNVQGWRQTTKEEMRRHPVSVIVYFVLRLIVVGVLVLNLLQRDYESAFICGLTLVLFLLPVFLEKHLRLDLPTVLEVVILLFIFAAEILGEISNYYTQYPYWDTMLHTVNGFLCAAFGFSLVDILSRNNQEKFRLSPLYVSLVAFCFSMTVGVLWEFFEYFADVLLLTDMQKDTVIHTLSSVALEGGVWENITSTTVNGVELGVGGYLDIGLHDTMADLLVNFFGAVAFSVIGYFYIRHRGKGRSGRLLRHFLPRSVDSDLPSEHPNSTTKTD